MTKVVIPFVRTALSQNPNLKAGADADPLEPYLRAMTVAFASLRRWHPQANLNLVSNAELNPRYMDAMARLGVTYVPIPFSHKPPAGFAKRFEASLYMLDALSLSLSGSTLYLDPDVLCIGPIDWLNEPILDHVVALKMNFSENEDINGLTRQGARELHVLLGEGPELPAHYGGELYWIPKPLAPIVQQRCEEAWKLSIARYGEGLSKFTTEEHILSYALRSLPLAAGEDYVRRIWTTHRHRTVRGDESGLALWHLPAEKDRGFRELYQFAIDAGSWFWNAEPDEFIDLCGKAMGLHDRGWKRFSLDVVGKIVSDIQGIVSTLGRG